MSATCDTVSKVLTFKYVKKKKINQFCKLTLVFFCSGAMLSIYGQRDKLKCSEIYCHYRDPKKILEQLSMNKSEYWVDVVSLVCIFLGESLISISKKNGTNLMNWFRFNLQAFVLLHILCYVGESTQFDECHYGCFILLMHLLLRSSLVCRYPFSEQCSFI